MELDGHRPALRVQPAGELVVARGPVEVVGDVVLTSPQELDRRPHRLGDLDRLGDEVDVDPPPEASAEEGGPHRDLLEREAARLGGHPRGHLLELGRTVDEAGVLADIGREVHGLHRGVGEEGQLVFGHELLGGAGQAGLHVALLLEHRARPGRGRPEAGGDSGGVE